MYSLSFIFRTVLAILLLGKVMLVHFANAIAMFFGHHVKFKYLGWTGLDLVLIYFVLSI